MTVWGDLPAEATNSGSLDGLRPLLEGLAGSGPVEETDSEGTWSVYTATENLSGPLALDPRTGAFSPSSSLTGTPIEFRDPNVSVAVGLHLSGPGGTRDGGWRVIVGAPSVAIRVPLLRGAVLDAAGQLRADPSQPTVAFVLPALRLRVQQLSGDAVGVKLLSASTTGSPTDNIYEFIRMEPSHALIGPGDTVGFAFRTAILDLSGTAGPSGVPATARAMPGDWQGLYLPEIRLFVAPSGLDGLAVSAGARDLWIGIGVHEGVTGIFEAEVVNRGGTPAITVRFHTASGEYIGDPGAGTAELPDHSTIFVDTAGGVAPIGISLEINGVTTNDDRAQVTTPATGSISITVIAHDAAGHDTSRTFIASRRAAAVSSGGDDGLVTVTPTRAETHRIVREAVSPTTVTVRLEPWANVSWSWPGGSVSAETAEIPVTAAGPVVVTATFPEAAQQTADCYFLFDRPWPEDGDAFAQNAENTHTAAAADRTHPSASTTFRQSMIDRLPLLGATTRLLVDGYASFEGPGHDAPPDRQHNHDLSARRQASAIGVLSAIGYSDVVPGTVHGHDDARDQIPIVAGGPTPAPGSSGWWLARVYSDVPVGPEICTAEIRRRPADVQTALDPRPPARARPDVFHKIGVRAEFVRSTFIRGEIYGEFDIETASESGLARNGQPALRSGPRNPDDGICLFVVRLRLSEDRGAWEVTAEFRAKDADLDGLAKMDQAHANQTALDILGALSIMAPLSASATNLSPAAGAVVALGSVALGASDLIHTHSLILRGGELKVSDGIVGADGTTTVADSGTQVSILLDLEVAFSFDLRIVRIDPAHPVTTRYKAIGVRSQWGSGTGLEYVPLPIFDSNRGYTLDVPAGALSAAPPLDELLRILGFRVSRDNPTYLEVEVGLGVDLGIITVDSVRVRARLDGPFDIQLTKLAATLDVPGTIHGKGSIEFTPLGFKGAFDLTVLPVNIRASAVLAVESTPHGLVGVLIGAEVDFPVPILLGNSGLGIYGFMGGVGVNYARHEPAGVAVPALDWLQAQFARPGGVMDPSGWQLTPGAYALAAGMLVGTVDDGFTVHLKGIVIIEVPGPRLLLIMKADVLSLPPVLNSNQSATFLAVLDIDFGRGTITIGIAAAYEIEKILKVRVPIKAFFDAQQPENWLVDLGSYRDRVTVEVLDVISGSGYLMVHGNGINLPTTPALVVPSGIAVAAGFHIQAVLMGSKAAGLYLEVAAGFDAILGLEPFYLAGIIYVSGELRLWIVGISAHAELIVQVGTHEVGGVIVKDPYIHGEVCGSVDFFFFSVEGCVSLTIGNPTTPTPAPPPLVAGISLVSRAPASLEGTGVAGPIDGKLTDAVDVATGGTVPSVPLDAIPAIAFRVAPTGSGNIVMGGSAGGSSGAAANPWTRIGDRWWRYELVSVAMNGPLIPATGKTPSVWWARPAQAGSATAPTLALLDWLPTAQSKAIPYGQALTNQVKHRWGTVCGQAAPRLMCSGPSTVAHSGPARLAGGSPASLGRTLPT
jgi:large repetitive protein